MPLSWRNNDGVTERCQRAAEKYFQHGTRAFVAHLLARLPIGGRYLLETAEQLHASIGDWARQWPHEAAGLERPVLLEAGHRQFEAIMCRTPAALQDEIYEAMHLLMYRLGLCARPRWAQR